MSSSDAIPAIDRKRQAEAMELCERLIQTIQAQTQAIHALAASNEAIVNAMLGPDDEPDPDAPTSYLNGQPIGH